MTTKIIPVTVANAAQLSAGFELLGKLIAIICPICDVATLTIDISTNNSTWIPSGTAVGVGSPSFGVGASAFAVSGNTLGNLSLSAGLYARINLSAVQTAQRTFQIVVDV